MKSKAYENKSAKAILINCLLIVIPLITGLAVYLIFDKDVIFLKPFARYLSFLPLKVNHSNNIFVFLRNYFCDFCWAFSLECSVFIFLTKDKKSLFISYIISSLVSIIIELFQKTDLVPGTFDCIDLFVQISAVLTAGLILKNIWRKKHE